MALRVRLDWTKVPRNDATVAADLVGVGQLQNQWIRLKFDFLDRVDLI
jgi:hypothetical protein